MCGASGKGESGTVGTGKKLLWLRETEGQVKALSLTALGRASTAIIKHPLANLQSWESSCSQIALSRVTPFSVAADSVPGVCGELHLKV